MALGRLHPSDEYDIRIAVEEGEGGSLDGKWIAMLVDEIEHYSGENTRLTALLAERDAEIARLREALSWYADERNYDVDDYDHEDVPGAMVNEDMRCSRCRLMGCGAYFEPDRGKRARAALAARGGEVQG